MDNLSSLQFNTLLFLSALSLMSILWLVFSSNQKFFKRNPHSMNAVERAAVISELMQRGLNVSFLHEPRSESPEQLQAIFSVLTPQFYSDFTNKLLIYRQLLQTEKQLRERVYMLEKLVAYSGFLHTPINDGLKLQQNQRELDSLREDLIRSEQELDDTIQDYRETEPMLTEIKRQLKIEHIKQLILDIRHKRTKILIYETNLRYLEQQKAKHSIYTPIHISNELELTKQEAERLKKEVQEQEADLKQTYSIDVERLQGIELLDEKQIHFLVEDIAYLSAKQTYKRRMYHA